jgi:hypothetical protein
MSDENQKGGDASSSIWNYGKSASMLNASKSDMNEVRKEMIRFALKHNIRDIRTYSGYKGDLLVEITTLDADLLPVLIAHAEYLGMKTALKVQPSTQIHELYCIMPDEEVYGLKE